MTYTTVIIGGGAGGLMAAAHLRGKTALIEQNRRIGEKLRVTGGGKCNVTNERITAEHFCGDPQLIQGILQNYSPADLRRDISAAGYSLNKRNAVVPGQYFFSSAEDILSFFQKQISRTHLFTGEKVQEITRETCFCIRTDKRTLRAENVIIATGGLSYPQLGVSAAGYEIAQSFGHSSIPTAPALTGFTLLPAQKWLTALSGLSLKAELTVEGKKIRGNILCAHRGITGPAAMNASLYWKKGALRINFMPGSNPKDLLKKAGNRSVSTALPLPKRFVKAFLQQADCRDMPLRRFIREHGDIMTQLQNYPFSPAGVSGYRRAEVTRGGVCTNELTENLESRRQAGLFFTGEVLDVTGELGGCNLQWAFSSAVTCARQINRRISARGSLS
ncbi:MAG: NAD(P)/FAD-dependent oxidoreductase [Fibrobacterota bacterium]